MCLTGLARAGPNTLIFCPKSDFSRRSKTALPYMTKYCKAIEDNIKTQRTSLLKNVYHSKGTLRLHVPEAFSVRLDHSISPIVRKAHESVCLVGM